MNNIYGYVVKGRNKADTADVFIGIDPQSNYATFTNALSPDCIKYTAKSGLASVNAPDQMTSFYGHERVDFDSFKLYTMRYDFEEYDTTLIREELLASALDKLSKAEIEALQNEWLVT